MVPWNKNSIGYTACVGIVLLLIASRRDNNNNDKRLVDEDGNESQESSDALVTTSSLPSSLLYQFVFDQLSRLRDLFFSSVLRSGEDYDREEDLDGETFVVHQGSCHCGSIAFEVSFGRPLGLFVCSRL